MLKIPLNLLQSEVKTDLEAHVTSSSAGVSSFSSFTVFLCLSEYLSPTLAFQEMCLFVSSVCIYSFFLSSSLILVSFSHSVALIIKNSIFCGRNCASLSQDHAKSSFSFTLEFLIFFELLLNCVCFQYSGTFNCSS